MLVVELIFIGLVGTLATEFQVFPEQYSMTFDGSHTQNVGFAKQALNEAFFGSSYADNGKDFTIELYFRINPIHYGTIHHYLMFIIVPNFEDCCLEGAPFVNYFEEFGKQEIHIGFSKWLRMSGHMHSSAWAPETSGHIKVELQNNTREWKCLKLSQKVLDDDQTQFQAVIQEAFAGGGVASVTSTSATLGNVFDPLGTISTLYIGGSPDQGHTNFTGEIGGFKIVDSARSVATMSTVYSGTMCNDVCSLIGQTPPVSCTLPFPSECGNAAATLVSSGYQFIAGSNPGTVQVSSPWQRISGDMYPLSAVKTATNLHKLIVQGWFRAPAAGGQTGKYIAHLTNKDTASSTLCTRASSTVVAVSIVDTSATEYQLQLEVGKSSIGCLAQTSAGPALKYGEWVPFYLGININFSGSSPQQKVRLQYSSADTLEQTGDNLVLWDGIGNFYFGSFGDKETVITGGEFYGLQVVALEPAVVMDDAAMAAQFTAMLDAKPYASVWPNCATWTQDQTVPILVECTAVTTPDTQHIEASRVYTCHPECKGCTGPTDHDCTVCQSGKAKVFGQICLTYCPTTFETCTASAPTDPLVLSVDLSKITRPLSTTQLTFGEVKLDLASSGKPYPTTTLLDAYYSGQRGYWFESSTMHLQNLILAPQMTFSLWTRPKTIGNIFTVHSGTLPTDILSLQLLGRGQVPQLYAIVFLHSGHEHSLETDLPQFADYTVNTTEFQGFSNTMPWIYTGLALRLLAGTQTSLEIMVDGRYVAQTTVPGGDYFSDATINNHDVGKINYVGFIHSIYMYNDYLSSTDINSRHITGQCKGVGSSCSICPTGECISTCAISQFIESDGACGTCPSTCYDAFVHTSGKTVTTHYVGCNKAPSCNMCEDPLCYRCYDEHELSCYECVPNATYNGRKCYCMGGTTKTVDNQCLLCPAGQYGTADGRCISCQNNCFECPSTEVCSVCADDYYMDPKSKTCVACPSTCGNCKANVCQGCAEGYLLQDGYCVLECSENYYLDAGTCYICPIGCIRCTSPTACSRCSDPLLLENGACNCPPGTYHDKEQNTCEACFLTCGTCADAPDRCTGCLPE